MRRKEEIGKTVETDPNYVFKIKIHSPWFLGWCYRTVFVQSKRSTEALLEVISDGYCEGDEIKISCKKMGLAKNIIR